MLARQYACVSCMQAAYAEAAAFYVGGDGPAAAHAQAAYAQYGYGEGQYQQGYAAAGSSERDVGQQLFHQAIKAEQQRAAKRGEVGLLGGGARGGRARRGLGRVQGAEKGDCRSDVQGAGEQGKGRVCRAACRGQCLSVPPRPCG